MEITLCDRSPAAPGAGVPQSCRRGWHAILSARRRDVGERLDLLGHGRGGRLPLGHVRRGRRVPDDAAADLRRHSRSRRGRHGDRPDPGVLGFGGARPVAPAQRRREDGSGAAGRRPGRLGGGRAACRRAAPLGRVRCVRRRLLRHLSWRHRHPDADRKHQHHTPGARRQDRCGAPLRSAQLGARAAAQDALSPLQALH